MNLVGIRHWARYITRVGVAPGALSTARGHLMLVIPVILRGRISLNTYIGEYKIFKGCTVKAFFLHGHEWSFGVKWILRLVWPHLTLTCAEPCICACETSKKLPIPLKGFYFGEPVNDS